MRVWLAIVAGLLATPAMAADQFDLVCKIGATTSLRYRVDLTRGEACEGECARVWKMGAVTVGELMLVDTVTNYPTELPQTVTVNRTTGVWRHWIGAARPVVEDGSCVAADFSGFPKAKF